MHSQNFFFYQSCHWGSIFSKGTMYVLCIIMYTWSNVFLKAEVFNPAPGDPLSWKVYFQPASAHLPAIFKQSWEAWLAASGVFD